MTRCRQLVAVKLPSTDARRRCWVMQGHIASCMAICCPVKPSLMQLCHIEIALQFLAAAHKHSKASSRCLKDAPRPHARSNQPINTPSRLPAGVSCDPVPGTAGKSCVILHCTALSLSKLHALGEGYARDKAVPK